MMTNKTIWGTTPSPTFYVGNVKLNKYTDGITVGLVDEQITYFEDALNSHSYYNGFEMNSIQDIIKKLKVIRTYLINDTGLETSNLKNTLSTLQKK
jgi:hypothetical protein